MKKLILMMFAGAMLFAASCTKTGPRGPQGVQGSQGVQGAQGPQGNANVDGLDYYTINTSAWSWSSGAYVVTFQDSKITDDIASTGLVMVYKQYGTNEWSNLPDINGINSTVFDFYPGYITLYNQNSDGSTPVIPSTNTYRVVVISSSLRKANPNTNWKNYNEAMAAINASKATTQATH